MGASRAKRRPPPSTPRNRVAGWCSRSIDSTPFAKISHLKSDQACCSRFSRRTWCRSNNRKGARPLQLLVLKSLNILPQPHHLQLLGPAGLRSAATKIPGLTIRDWQQQGQGFGSFGPDVSCHLSGFVVFLEAHRPLLRRNRRSLAKKEHSSALYCPELHA